MELLIKTMAILSHSRVDKIGAFQFEEFELRRIKSVWILKFKGKRLRIPEYETECLELLAQLLADREMSDGDFRAWTVKRLEFLNKSADTSDPKIRPFKEYKIRIKNALESKTKTNFIEAVRPGGYKWVYPHVTELSISEVEREASLISKIGITGTESFIRRHQDFTEQITEQLIHYSEFRSSGTANEKEFCVGVGGVLLRRHGESLICDLAIPENPFVAYDVPTRDFVERFPPKVGYHPAKIEIEDFLKKETNTVRRFLGRVTAGGAITVLRVPSEEAYEKDRVSAQDFEPFILITQRDAQAPVDRLKLCPQSGISECMKETFDWHDPRRLVIGECMEELRFVADIKGEKYALHLSFAKAHNKDDNWPILQAKVEQKKADRLFHLQNNADNRNPLSGMPLELKATEGHANAKILPIGTDLLSLDYPPLRAKDNYTAPTEFKGFLAIDPNIGVVDFMAVVEIEMPVPLSKLAIMDGEVHKNNFLRRRILAFTPIEFKKMICGEASKIKFFGCVENSSSGKPMEWVGNISGSVAPRPKMAIPLAAAAPRVLNEIFGFLPSELSPYDQSISESAELILDEPEKYGQPV